MTGLKAIDLFCGAGGLSLGLEEAGFEIPVAVDSWKLAVDTYSMNLNSRATCADLSSLEGKKILEQAEMAVSDLDLLAGGPPCQGFSIQRIGDDVDPRNQMVLEFARYVDELQPRMFVMENVLGLLGRRGQALVSEFAARVRASGYNLLVQRINASSYGVPQHRRRAIFIGVRTDSPAFVLDAGDDARVVSVDEALHGLPDASPPGTKNSVDPMHVASKLSPLNRQRLALIPPGGGFEDLPPELRVSAHQRGAAQIGHRGVYGRLDGGQPAGTITARFDSFTRGRFAHPLHHRNITLREGARLQTFPDSFVFLGNREEVAAQIGNAVPPRMAAALGTQLARHLLRHPAG